MRVKIEYTVEVDNDFRREINIYYGKDGLATRQEVQDWFRSFGDSMNDDLGAAAEEREEREEMYKRVREEYGDE